MEGLRKKLEQATLDNNQVIQEIYKRIQAEEASGESSLSRRASAADVQKISQLKPQWRKSFEEVPEEQLKLAQKCWERGYHMKNPKWFADSPEFEGKEQPMSWLASVCEKGCCQLNHRAWNPVGWQITFERPGASYWYTRGGKTCYEATATCKHCRGMLVLITDEGKLTPNDDNAALDFFLLERFEYPDAIVR